jgi:predicted nucleotidyltransferase
MELNEIKEIAEMITRDFPGKVRAFIFGSTARLFKEDADPDEQLLDEVFNSSDLDILFEISQKVFEEYAEECYYSGLTPLGKPSDPLNLYWEYFSLAETRWEAVSKIFVIDELQAEEIVSALDGKKVGIILLPFEWQKNEAILEIIDYHDPEFSKNIQGDRILLFEK